MNRDGANRRVGAKKGIDIEEARRKREDNVIELRKTKREENLLKKRQTFAAPQYALEDSNKGGGGQRVGVLLAVCSLQAHTGTCTHTDSMHTRAERGREHSQPTNS